ncbi:hypothetical protein Gotri_023076 [Gossypium trilobum]|uniref:SCP domain-containing protein n=1 Tax=Gossypium trilobum TaxID=34281 RepID=A0A7J9DIP2_9ROSI|nr:hypothetical protein [Gossypium trilobum]
MGTQFSVAICLMAFTLAYVSLAQNPSNEDYLNVHNAARAKVGVGPMTWDATVAAYAQQYASKRIADCDLIHSTGPYGENLAEASYALSGAEAVTLWVDEKPHYNYDANQCVGGECLHYTQVGKSIEVVGTFDAYFLWSMATQRTFDLAYLSPLLIATRLSIVGRGVGPPQYRLSHSDPQDKHEDFFDDVPFHHEDPPHHPPLSHPTIVPAVTLADLYERFTRFEQYYFEQFDSIDATLQQICQHLHISSTVPAPHDPDASHDDHR